MAVGVDVVAAVDVLALKGLKKDLFAACLLGSRKGQIERKQQMQMKFIKSESLVPHNNTYPEGALVADDYHGVKGGEHAGLEQLLGRDAGPAQFLVEFVKEGRELLEHEVHPALDGAQRMVGGHALVQVDNRQEIRLGLRLSTIDSLIQITPPCSNSHETILPTC